MPGSGGRDTCVWRGNIRWLDQALPVEPLDTPDLSARFRIMFLTSSPLRHLCCPSGSVQTIKHSYICPPPDSPASTPPRPFPALGVTNSSAKTPSWWDRGPTVGRERSSSVRLCSGGHSRTANSPPLLLPIHTQPDRYTL